MAFARLSLFVLIAILNMSAHSASARSQYVLVEHPSCYPRPPGSNPTLTITKCRDLKLNAAGGVGVPGVKRHDYVLRGTCIRYLARQDRWGKPQSGVPGAWIATVRNEKGRSFVNVSARWDVRTNTLHEVLTFEGGNSGSISTKFKCGLDPYLNKVSCVVLAHSNATRWPSLSYPVQFCKLPFGQGKVNRQHASALSQKGGSQKAEEARSLPSAL